MAEQLFDTDHRSNRPRGRPRGGRPPGRNRGTNSRRGRGEGNRGRPRPNSGRGNRTGSDDAINDGGGNTAGRGGRGGRGRNPYGRGMGRLNNPPFGHSGRTDDGRGRGNRGGRGRGGRHNHQPNRLHRLDIGDIMDMRRKQPEDIAIALEQDIKGFQVSLSSCDQIKGADKVGRYIEAIIEIMLKVSRVGSESSNIVMAEFLSDRCATFHLKLGEYIQLIDDINQSRELLHMLCDLCDFVLKAFPSSWSVLPIGVLRETIERECPELASRIAVICQRQAEIKDAHRHQTRRKTDHDSYFDNWDNSQYRQMSILPTVKEITEAQPPLRSNIIKGCYSDWEHYYDIQFRLLREDFISPLRKGIFEFCLPNRTHRLNDVYIYREVQITKPVCTMEGVCFEVQFDVSRMRLYRSWEHSKRLMFGSLLCFTTDYFTHDIQFATVIDRDPKKLEKGIFQVRFENPLGMLHHMKQTTFIVAESKAFFEASRHVLRSLQTAEVGTMPFSRYLVLNQPTPVNPPKYFEPGAAIYDLKWLYTKRYRKQGRASTKINVLDDEWPTANDPGIELDQSQLDAIKMALTQEISIIQGPPGTGKTYIGYKIVQTLLENREVWDPHKTSPILVMCYTNHALDQFLEGIIHLDISRTRRHGTGTGRPNIVRIGSRSQSEEIQKCSLREVRSQYYKEQRFWNVRNMKRECEKFGSTLAFNNQQIESISIEPVNQKRIGPEGMEDLKPFIHPSHYYQLTQLAINDDQMKYALEMWLGLWAKIKVKKAADPPKEHNESLVQEPQETGANNHEQDGSTNTSSNGGAIVNEKVEEPEVEKEDLVDVEGDAEIEQKIRKVDSEDYKQIEAAREVKEPQDALSRLMQKKPENSEDTNEDSTEDATEEQVDEEQIEFIWQKKTPRTRNGIIAQINRCQSADSEPDEFEDITEPSFPYMERYRLLLLWIQRYEESLRNDNIAKIPEHDRMCREYKEADQNLDRVALEQAEVIGMTTTGAAKYQHIIHLVKPKIVIVEEAAELLESHIVSALNGGTQHLILIGDHKQLRPKPNEYDLAMKHNLHISLFERLILNGHPHATLEIQHRMRPQISRLVRYHVYETLIDHETVLERKDVTGFRKNMYFFHHEHEEQHDENLSSHSNDYEATFIARLCEHLLKLGYSPSRITILTGYTGQLLKVRSKMPRKVFNGVRIINVDNFQGEENDIIILSLVRNNNDGRVGFLKEENRVCVALSRAREGLFCFGNFHKLLCAQVPIWRRIMTQVEAEGCLGSAFPLQCPNHPDMKCDVDQPELFATFAPSGGCTKHCQARLDCGHSCKRMCHIDDAEHEEYKCQEPCSKMCEEGEHKCPARCYQPCPPCRVIVTRTMPRCGHPQKMRCHQDPWEVQCRTPCLKLCPNKLHLCPLKCFEGCRPCVVAVKKEMPGCGHKQSMECREEPEKVRCINPCDKSCPNGHPCKKLCWKDCGQCEIKVRRKLPNCEHYKGLPCHLDPALYECQKDCSRTVYDCKHPCPKKCFEKCDPVCSKLVLKFLPKCCHVDYIPCHRDPEEWSCTKPCEKKLICGHQCKQKCGETCLSMYCTEPTTIELDCGHEFTEECHRTQFMFIQKEVSCEKPCRKTLECGHPCKNRCCDPCTVNCNVVTETKCLRGVHKVKTRCGSSFTHNNCNQPCPNKLSCGHSCTKKCKDECNDGTCEVKIDINCDCGHKHKVKCSEKDKPCSCKKKCDKNLSCGHQCKGDCGDCFNKRIHLPCPYEVHVKRFCGHYINQPCFGLESTQCTKDCQKAVCPHSTSHTDHKCHEPCDTDCSEPCMYQCKHHQCIKSCSQKCSVSSAPCNKPCDKMLECKHQCLGMCGEKCLSRCLICDRKKFLDSVPKVALEKKTKPESVQYIELGCGHMFPVKYLDHYYQYHKGKDRLVSPLLCPVCSKISVDCGRYKMSVSERTKEIREVQRTLQQNDLERVSNIELKYTKFELSFRSLSKKPDYGTFLRFQREKFGDNSEAELMLDILIILCKLREKLTVAKNSRLEELAIQLFRNVSHFLTSDADADQTVRLSLQFINDIVREIRRINLLYMMGKAKWVLKSYPKAAEKAGKDFAEVQQFIDRTKRGNSELISDVYTACVIRLTTMYNEYSSIEELTELVDISTLPEPVITKGAWYRCAKAGHLYFVPTKFKKGKQAPVPSCELCR